MKYVTTDSVRKCQNHVYVYFFFEEQNVRVKRRDIDLAKDVRIAAILRRIFNLEAG